MKSLEGERRKSGGHPASSEVEEQPLPAVLVLSGAASPSSWIGDALTLEGCAVQRRSAEQPFGATLEFADFEVVLFELVGPELLVAWCEFFRNQPNRPALLVVSSEIQLQIQAFQAGVDDCVSEASDASQMIERVCINVRRLRTARAANSAKRVISTPSGTLAVSLGPLVALDGVPLDLPRVQIRLLRMLMEASQPVSVGELASSVWPGELVAVHTVHTQIALLRSRLECLGITVEHIRRAGYVLSVLQSKEA